MASLNNYRGILLLSIVTEDVIPFSHTPFMNSCIPLAELVMSKDAAPFPCPPAIVSSMCVWSSSGFQTCSCSCSLSHTDSPLLTMPKQVQNGSGFLVFIFSPRSSTRFLSCSQPVHGSFFSVLNKFLPGSGSLYGDLLCELLHASLLLEAPTSGGRAAQTPRPRDVTQSILGTAPGGWTPRV